MKPTLKRRVILLIVTLAVIAVVVAEAYSAYTPRWLDRPPNAAGGPVDHSVAVASDAAGVYVASVYRDPATGRANSSITKYDFNGNRLATVDYYITGGSVYFNDLSAVWGSLYVALTVSSNTVNASIARIYEENLSVAGARFLSLGLASAGYAVCPEASGEVGLVGTALYEEVNNGSRIRVWEGFLYVYDSQLNQLRGAVYIANFSGTVFNMSFWDCVIGPDGYAYVAGTLYYWNGAYNFPVYLLVAKVNWTSPNIVANRIVPLYNSQYYVVYHRGVAGIATDGARLIVAFTYTDERPNATSPTTGGSILVLDAQLNVLARRNLTTDYNDFFYSVQAGTLGDYAVAGATGYDFGTGLGTSYLHGLALVFNPDNSLESAVLAGATDNNTAFASITTDPQGNLYVAGTAFSDRLVLYNVTGEAGLALQSRAAPSLAAAERGQANIVEAFRPPEGGLVLEQKPAPTGGGGVVAVNTAEPRPQARPQATPSGASSGLIVAMVENLSPPPPPIPEPWMASLAALAAGAYILLRGRRRGV